MKFAVKLFLGFLMATLAQAKVTSVPEFDKLMTQYGNDVQLSAGAIYDAGVTELRLKYSTALEKALKAAQDAGNLDAALAYKNEVKLMADNMEVPAESEKTSPDLQKMRGIYHQSLARLVIEKGKATNPIINALIVSLDRLVVTLTKAGRLEEALFVQKKKETLGEETAKAAAKSASAVATKTSPAKGTVTNSLGMKFVPVPGTQVLFCIHETRRQDYEAFAAKTPGTKDIWKKPRFHNLSVSPKDDHPVTSVSLNEAKAFCAWLSKKEGKTYRVPTDYEWSCAVGISEQENAPAGTQPNQLSGKLQGVFPWGGKYPPKAGELAGNYADTTLHDDLDATQKQAWIEGYSDGYATTSPVMKFKPNPLGLYDLGGNVWEWCSDLVNGGKNDWYVLRGGGFNESAAERLLSSTRISASPDGFQTYFGFRVVLEHP